MRNSRRVWVAALIVVAIGACYWMRSSRGGGQTEFTGPRLIRAEDIALPAGYRIEAVAAGLTFPTGVAFDDTNDVYVVESGCAYGEVFATPRLLRVGPTGELEVVATGGRNGPWTGVVFHEGVFYAAEGGQLEGGRILRITPDGRITAIVESLPSVGDHHTNGPAIGPDGWIYFGQGTATNSGVVGEDNAQFGWLSRNPDFHDIPCRDITLAGVNFESKDTSGSRTVTTGAFSPFGTATTAGQVVRGEVPCNGAVMKVSLAGGQPELVAWGFRNPFGLAFAPDGRLYVTDNGYDERGSRPVFGSGDYLWRVEPGTWHGWPDFAGGRPFFDDDIQPVLAAHPGRPPEAVAIFGVHSSADGFDFSRNPAFRTCGRGFRRVARRHGAARRQGAGARRVQGGSGRCPERRRRGLRRQQGRDERPRFLDRIGRTGAAGGGPLRSLGSGALRRRLRRHDDDKPGAPAAARNGRPVEDHTSRRLVIRGGASVLALAGCVVLAACGPARRSEPLLGPLRLSDPAEERGGIVFMSYCQSCHPGGEAGLGPALNDKPLPDFLKKVQVRNGLGSMPSFSDEEISNRELDDLMAYLGALCDKEGDPPEPASRGD
jgi:glucose/arabinose dehydrogenase